MRHILSWDEIQSACSQYVVRTHYPELNQPGENKYSCRIQASFPITNGTLDVENVTITVYDVEPWV